MALGRPKAPLVLTAAEQQTLDSWAHRARTAPAVARRARIVLACARGLDNPNRGEEAASLAADGRALADPLSRAAAGWPGGRAAPGGPRGQ